MIHEEHMIISCVSCRFSSSAFPVHLSQRMYQDRHVMHHPCPILSFPNPMHLSREVHLNEHTQAHHALFLPFPAPCTCPGGYIIRNTGTCWEGTRSPSKEDRVAVDADWLEAMAASASAIAPRALMLLMMPAVVQAHRDHLHSQLPWPENMYSL